MDKQRALKQLEQKLRKDNTLPLRESNVVFGEGSLNPRAMFIGEAPGKNEDLQGRPFVGATEEKLQKNTGIAETLSGLSGEI